MMKNNFFPTRTPKEYLLLVLKGFSMGAADVVPGVSGGTMAFITGIYPELIASIKSLDLLFFKRVISFRFKEAFDHVPWPFLVTLVCGILLAVFSIARVLSWLLYHHPVYIWSFFFGLIMASVITVARSLERWTVSTVFWLAVSTIGTFWIVGLVPAQTPEAPWFLFISGAVAICAMILPGISGAFILLLLGKYHFVLDAVNHKDFLTLGLVAAGAVIGLLTFVRILNWCFVNYREFIIAVLTGLMLGSLRKVWPWKTAGDVANQIHGTYPAAVNVIPGQLSIEFFAAIVLIGLGFGSVMTIQFFSSKKRILTT